jgi:hypothetical protein
MTRQEFLDKCRDLAFVLGERRGDELVYDDGWVRVLLDIPSRDVKVMCGGDSVITTAGGEVVQDMFEATPVDVLNRIQNRHVLPT